MPTAPTRRADPGLPKSKNVALATIPSPADPVRFRKRVERAIEELINLLDRLDPDPDLEPSLGFLERHPPVWFGGGDYTAAGSQLFINGGSYDDREAEHDEAEPDADDEPSLGATATIDQRKGWRRSLDDLLSPDREDDGAALSPVLHAGAR